MTTPSTPNPVRSPDAALADPVRGAARLKSIPIFARLTDLELKKLYTMGELIKLKAKANAVIEGEPTRGVFVLLSGTVSVYKTDPATGKLSRLAFLEEGSHFGELSLFDYAPRSATVTAETPCVLFHLDADEFRQFLANEGDGMQVRFYRTCAEELVERFRKLNADYMTSQHLLWKYAMRRGEETSAAASPVPSVRRALVGE